MLTFVVEGTPVPQGSKTAAVINGRAVMFDSNKKLKAWRSDVTLVARHAAEGMEPFDDTDGLEIELAFFMLRPKSVTRSMPTTKPDLDKLVRAVMDSITDAGVWADDSKVVKIYATKSYTIDTPKVICKIRRFTEKSVQ